MDTESTSPILETNSKIDPMNPWGAPDTEEVEEGIIEETAPEEFNNNMITSSKITFPKLPSINIFPEKLENSGYIILATVALLVGLCFLILTLKMRQAIIITQKNTQSLKDMMTALFINQQNLEYKLLLDEFNNASSQTDKENTKIQLLNYMNNICREICETQDSELAKQIGEAFISKIQGRYLKIKDLTQGVDYFRFLGELSVQYGNYLSGRDLIQKIREEYKKNLKNQKRNK